MRGLLLAGVLLVSSACRPPGPDRAPADPAPVDPAGGAASETMCAEHGVLTAVCPRCNPALIAVFQAKGDWCVEHGFPESFCPTCSPERGGRPATDVSEQRSEAPVDGTRVRFKTRETARLAGIETVHAREAERHETVTATLRLVYDAANVALVSAPVSGVVSEIRADVGAQVTRGAALAVIQSAVIGAGRSQEAAARSRVALADLGLIRQRDLLAAGVTSVREAQEAEQVLATARAELAALESQLEMVGTGSGGAYSLRAPLTGEVTRRAVSLGMGIEGGAPLFEIIDASRLWAELDVSEADLRRVAVGNMVSITLDTLGDRVYTGAVSYIAPSVSVTTRTTLVRVPLDNAERVLRGNMYGTGRIAVTDTAPTVTVPAAAVQRVNGVDLVFVRLAEDEFEARRVTVRSRHDGEVRLADGVRPGEPVATTGSFMLKTETLKDSIGAGCCDVD